MCAFGRIETGQCRSLQQSGGDDVTLETVTGEFESHLVLVAYDRVRECLVHEIDGVACCRVGITARR